MTNEEVIKKMQAVKAYMISGNPIWSVTEMGEAFDMAIEALQGQRWIPVKTRPMTEEERKEWSKKLGYDIDYDEAVIYTSQLPDDGQECIVCTKWGDVFIDTFQNDPDYGCCFDEHGDMDGITAWMPLPEPYAERRTDETD